MEKAKFSITKSKRGKVIVELVFENMKRLTLLNFKFNKIESLNGRGVEVERNKGQVVKIVMEGKEIFSRQTTSGSGLAQLVTSSPQILKMRHTSSITNPATAPYNFVPLNDKVVPTEEMPPDFDRYYIGKTNTGYIELNIETKTPIYVHGTLTETEVKNKVEGKNKSDFFSPAEKLRIPGSSLRGMIRTLVEIMSYGKFGFFDKKRLYYRGMADKAISLRAYYQQKIGTVYAGILYKDKLTYFIEQTSFSKISKPDAQLKVTALGKTYKKFKFYDVGTEFLVVSGDMPGKNNDWLIRKKNGSGIKIEVSKEDVDSYANDVTREKNAPNLYDLISRQKIKDTKKDGVPCFFVKWKDKDGKGRVSFGHTRMFRLAYVSTVGDHIPETLKKDFPLDIPEAIFGNEKTFACRVFLEDAFLKDPTGNDCEGEKVVTLLGPKPTTFQHYLVQTEENMANHPRNLAHYDSNPPTAIRGYKLYWHRENQTYKNTKFDSNIDNKIQPVKADKTFTGRIRFENLYAVELGALLSALDLPQDCCHKLGMGKPLGLGSVKITPTLHLSKRKQRYESLDAEWGEVSESTKEGEKIKDFKDAFEKYVLSKLGENGKSFWELERMKELEKMLKFDPKPKDSATAYMTLGKFSDRKVLPSPSDI